jgi:hypothetical protein
MANSNFVVKNGLTVGALTIDAATGNITTSGTISGDLSTTSIAKNDTSIALNDTGSGSDVAVTIDGTEIFTITSDGIVPSVDSNGSNGFSLGSASFAWKDVYVSSGSLYVNGQKVLQDDSGTIVVSADANQNLSLQTSGSGNVELDPTGSGTIQLKGTVQIEAGNNITSSDGNAITFSNSIDVDAIESRSTDTDLTLTANGTGKVYINDNLTVTGSISGTGATVSFADNIVDLNADFTSGAPSENGGIRILRGDSNAATLLFNETSDVWQVFDGTNTHDIVGADDTQTLTNKTLTSPNMTSPAIGGTTITATAVELNYVDGVTSAIQTQLDAKAPLASPALTGTATAVNLTISGDLTVNGTTTTVNTETINLADNVILINSNATGTPTENGGIEIERGSSSNVSFVWDETNDEWTTSAQTLKTGHFLPETDVTYDLGSTSLKWRDLYLSGSTIKLGSATISDSGGAISSSGGFSGNATTASAWETARTLSLTGAVTGSASIDGSGNVSLTTTATSDPVITLTGDVTGSGTMTNLGSVSFATTIAANSVALGTDTTGNYVATGAVSGVGLSGSSSSEGGTFTVTSNATSANTASTIVARDGSGNFSAGTITAALSGNASTASTWQTARTNTVTLTGDVTGSGSTSVDGSGNWTVSMATTVAANSVALGTDTTGNYVGAGATSGNGISGSVSSEGGTFTVTSNATSANTASTIVFRDASGNFSAGVMTGTSTQAQYADLAENYVGDMKYEAGTVVEFGGAEEVTKAGPGSPRIAGVVSTAPGFLMNTGLTGATVVAVAYTGRVPTKILGPCRKGDIMVAGPNGTATRATSEPKAGMIIGKALANFDGNSGVVEIAVGR